MKSVCLITSVVFILIMISCSESKNSESIDKDTEVESIGPIETVPQEIESKTIEESDDQSEIVYLKTPFRAYVSDPSGSPTNIRKEPSGDVIMTIPNQSDYIIIITAKSGRWFMIEEIDAIDTTITIPNNVGWIHGSVIGIATRNYGGEELSLYTEPDSGSEIVTTFKQEVGLKLIDLDGIWAKVEYKNQSGVTFEGWIKREWLCGNPLTNCC